jgi:hypothetical protein
MRLDSTRSTTEGSRTTNGLSSSRVVHKKLTRIILRRILEEEEKITNFTYFDFSRCETWLGEKADLDWVGMHLSHTSNAAARVL